MFNFHYVTKEDIKQHNASWPEIPHHPTGSGSAKNPLIILINYEPGIDKISLYNKDPYEAKQMMLTKEKVQD